MYEFKKACEMETDKGTFEVIYPRLYSNIDSSNTKIGCIFEFATDFVYSLINTCSVLVFGSQERGNIHIINPRVYLS